MAEGSDHTQPSGTSREQILRDLEAAGLLRLLDAKPGHRRASAPRAEETSRVIADLRWSHGRARKRRLALVLCALVLAMIALAYATLLILGSGGWPSGR